MKICIEQCNHIIFIFRHLCYSVLICVVIKVSFPQWSTDFAPFLSVPSILSTLWVNTNLFSSYVFCNYFSGSFLSALNCGLVSCVTSIFFIVYVGSLLRLPLAKSSASCEPVNFKLFFCADLNCSSTLLSPVSNWFLSFGKIQHKNTTLIQHADTARTTRYNTTWSPYNVFTQHTNTTRKSKI